MGRIPDELRRIIAANIKAERQKKFPGRGGAKLCAEAFGVSPQQWSPWERGMRTPDEIRLGQLAAFFGVTVEYMRSEHAAPKNGPDEIPPPADEPIRIEPSLHAVTCSESDIIWHMHRIYSGTASNGQRVHVALNITLSREAVK